MKIKIDKLYTKVIVESQDHGIQVVTTTVDLILQWVSGSLIIHHLYIS